MRHTARTACILLALVLLAGQALSGVFWGSKESGRYHYPDCQIAKEIPAESLVVFNSPDDATRAGYFPCQACSPPWPEY